MGRKKIVKEIILNSDSDSEPQQQQEKNDKEPFHRSPQTVKDQTEAREKFAEKEQDFFMFGKEDDPAEPVKTDTAADETDTPAALKSSGNTPNASILSPSEPKAPKKKAPRKRKAVTAAASAKPDKAEKSARMTEAKMRKKIEKEMEDKKRKEEAAERAMEERVRRIVEEQMKRDGYATYVPPAPLSFSTIRPAGQQKSVVYAAAAEPEQEYESEESPTKQPMQLPDQVAKMYKQVFPTF